MLPHDQVSWRTRLRIVIITLAFIAIALGIVGQASAGDDIFFDGFVYDTDGVTPARAAVVVYYPAYPSGIATSTFMDGYWPYGYYLIKGERTGGTATMYAYTYSGDMDHSYMDRKSPEAVVNLDGIANGSHVTRNLTLQALPHEPGPTVTFQGRVTRSGREAAFAHVFVSYGSYLWDKTADAMGYYNFQLSYANYPIEMWVTCDGYTSSHWTTTASAGDTVNHDWDLPIPPPTSTPPPFQTPTPRPCPTPTPVPVKPYITYTGLVYCDGVPVKDAGVFCTYGGDTTGVATNETGRYLITTPNRGGLATIRASYFGTAAENYLVFPEYGSIVSHDFYINTSQPDSSTPSPTVKAGAPTPTIAAGSSSITITPQPTPKVSATPHATPGNSIGRPATLNIDLYGLLKTAALVAGGVIVVLLVLYCLAILIVTKL